MATVRVNEVELKSRRLPPVCVVTGEPGTTFVKWTASKHHPSWSLLLILFGILPLVIYLAVTSRSVTVQLPATQSVQQRLRSDRRLYWGIGIGGFMLTFGVVWFTNAFVLVGVLAMAFAFFLRWFLQGRDWVWAYLESDGEIVIGGCSETFATAVEAWRPAVRTS